MQKRAKISIYLHFSPEFLMDEKIAPKKGYQNARLYVIIHRPGTEGGVHVSKHIHLDEQACSVYLIIRATFSPWGLHAHLSESRVFF